MNEKKLLIKIAEGDEIAFKSLFVKYWDQIYSTAFMFLKSPEMAEDMAQEVFLQIWLKRDKLKEINKFDSFLFITARNLIYDRLRKGEIITCEYENTITEYFKDISLTPHAKLELKEMEESIQNSINSLPKQQQTAFRLSRFEGLNHEEIAKEMGVSKQNVKSYIVRAISRLRQEFVNAPN